MNWKMLAALIVAIIVSPAGLTEEQAAPAPAQTEKQASTEGKPPVQSATPEKGREEELAGKFFGLSRISDPFENIDAHSNSSDTFVAQNPQFTAREIRFTISETADYNIRDFLLYREELLQQLKSMNYTVYSLSEDRQLQRSERDDARSRKNRSGDDDDDDDSASRSTNPQDGASSQQASRKGGKADPATESRRESEEIARIAAEIRKSGVVSSFTINYAGKRLNAEPSSAASYGMVRAVMLRNNLGQIVILLNITEAPGLKEGNQ